MLKKFLGNIDLAFSSKQYLGVRKVFSRYWGSYGGVDALVRSPYFHFAILFTALLSPEWVEPMWWDRVISVMPNVLGFSLGGYAIWLGFGDKAFIRFLSGVESGERIFPFVSLSSSFVNFIVLQFLSIFLAIAAGSYFKVFGENFFGYVFWGVGYFFFVYSLLSALAATMQIFRISTMYEMYNEKMKKKEVDGEGE